MKRKPKEADALVDITKLVRPSTLAYKLGCSKQYVAVLIKTARIPEHFKITIDKTLFIHVDVIKHLNGEESTR